MFPPQGWPAWMNQQLKQADFILAVCTEPYRRRFEGEEPEGTGKGAKFEGALITQAIYEAECRNRRFVPVIVSSSDDASIPTVLRAYTRFDVSTPLGFETLYSFLTGQPAVQAPAIGNIRTPNLSFPARSSTSKTGFPKSEEAIGSRLNGKLAIDIDASGPRIIFELASTAVFPLFIENPIVRVGSASEDMKLGESYVEMLPLRPASGPLNPTERRTYFIPGPHIHLLWNEMNRTKGQASIIVRSGAGEELRISTGVELMIREVASSAEDRADAVGLSPEGMALVMSLLQKRMCEHRSETYAVYPPRILLDNPAIAHAEDVIERLRGEPFAIEFKGEQPVRVSFIELLALTQQLIQVSLELGQILDDLERAAVPSAQLKLNFTVNAELLLKPEMARVLLSKIAFAEISSEEALRSSK